jgi:PAS domain S-box-containing protein
MEKGIQKTILLVEDELIIALAESQKIKTFGYNVVTANSGEEAVELAGNNQEIQLVLMDIDLGKGIDGPEAAKQILEKRNIPIVFLSSHAEKDYVDRVKEITRYGYVIKNSGDFVLRSSIEMAFELYESEEKYRSAFRISPDAININSMDGLYIDINEGFIQMTGYSREEVIGKLSSEIHIWVNPSDRERLIRGLRTQGMVENLEAEFRMKDGSIKTGLMSARIITFQNTPHILSITRDISHLKKKNREIEKSEEIHKKMVSNISDVIAIMDADGTLKYKSPNIEKWFGWKPDDLVGTNGWDTVHPDDLERMQKEFFSLLEKDNSQKKVEYRYKCKDGGYKLISLTAVNLVHDSDINGVLMNYHDITERKQTEYAFFRSQELLNEMGKIAQVGGWAFETETQELLWTDEMFSIYEVESSFVPTFETATNFFISESRQKLILARQVMMETGEPYDLELEFITAKGNHKWVRNIGRVKRFNGKITGRTGIMQDITNQKQSKEIQRESEEKYRLLYENTGVGIGYYKPDGTIISFNRLAASHKNSIPEDFNGKSIYDIFPKKEAEIYHERIKKSVLSDTPVVYEDEIQLPTGKKHFLSTFTKVVDANQNIRGIQIISQDISERKVFETALVKSQDLLNEMSRIAKIGGWKVDGSSKQVEWSEELYRIFEVDASFIPTVENVREFFTSNSREKLNLAVKNLMELGIPLNLELEIKTAQGNHRYLRLNGRPGYTDGKITYRVGTTQDITEQKLIEEKLKESELKYRTFIEHSSDVIFAVDEKGEYKFANQVFASTLGRSPEYFIGKTFWDIYPKEHADHRQSTSKKVFETGESQSVEVVVPLPERTLHYLAKANPIKDETGKVIMNLTHAIDITERKLAEDKIKKLLAEKEILLKEVQHRIKNNLNIMNSLLSLQASNEKDPSVVTALKDVQNRFQSMSVLYERLFQTENLNEMSVKDYIPQFLNAIINPFSGMSNVKIVANVDDFMLGVKELSTLGIIINELITNSMKYAFIGKSDGLITVAASKKNDHAIFCIEDNGIGLPESINLKNSTGFGLMLVNALTEQLKGTIRIEREKGTKFIIEFEIS